MTTYSRALVVLAVVGWGTLVARASLPTNALLFVTQVPIPTEQNATLVKDVAVSVVSALGNHLADTAHAGRGGDLWMRYPNGAVKNLTRAAGFGTGGNQDGVGIAVRDPQVHWSGTKALFSMVVGAPAGAGDAHAFFWQLYELTNLAEVLQNSNAVPSLVRVANQPSQYNNVMACYSADERILFACDRPRNGAAHLYPQLDEYNDIPTNTGLWILNPATGELTLLDHSPSGAFHPFLDSFGRIIFTRWDHMVQDRNATDDRMGRGTNGTFNYFSEDGREYDLSYRPVEQFPEPRTYDSNELARLQVQGNAINSFFPWMMNEDGTGLEFLNHIGRHELLRTFRGSSFTNDPNLRQQFNLTPGLRFNSNYLDNFMQIREDPRRPGVYFGTDAPDFGTHAAGQLVTLFGPPGTNAERMFITYVTPKGTAGPNATGVYRDACPTADGSLVAVYSRGNALDVNSGSATLPRSSYHFRLITLTNAGAFWTNESLLTAGWTNEVSYWKGNIRVTNTEVWELQPVEVAPRLQPAPTLGAVDPIEAQVVREEGVILGDLQAWLRTNELALLVSRNVTMRDRADREQPFNLRVAGTTTQTFGTNTGRIYDVRYLQYIQADQLRGLTYGVGTNPVPGRRVLGVPLHEAAAVLHNLPAPNVPSGSTRVADDGSQAAFLPARRAMTHQLTDTNGNVVVRERYWLTYQPGEIRTCANCHGINTANQAGQSKPTNPPFALRELLRFWKEQTGYTKILGTQLGNGLMRLAISASPLRTNVVEATSDFQSWQPIGTNAGSTNGVFSLDDPNGAPQRFYRVRGL